MPKARVIGLSVIVVVGLLAAIGFVAYRNHESRVEAQVAHALLFYRQRQFSDQLHMRCNQDRYVKLDEVEQYSGFVYVTSAAEALRYPNNVIACWPGDKSGEVVDRINWAIETHKIDLTESRRTRMDNIGDYHGGSLEAPVTMTEVLAEWDAAQRLLASMEYVDWVVYG